MADATAVRCRWRVLYGIIDFFANTSDNSVRFFVQNVTKVRMEGIMVRLTISEAREDFAAVLKTVAGGERVLLRRHGKPVAAIVPVEDLALLRAIEDRMDAKAAREALADYEANGAVSWEDAKAELGP
jgi:prevent-host-death family protein